MGVSVGASLPGWLLVFLALFKTIFDLEKDCILVKIKSSSNAFKQQIL